MSNVVVANYGHVEVPYSSLRTGTFFAALCRSVIMSFGRKKDGCTWGYNTFKNKLNISRSTVWRQGRAMRKDDAFEIVRLGKERSELRYKKQLKKEKHLHVKNWFCTEEFLFTYKDDRGQIVATKERSLKPSEVAVLSFVYTLWRINVKLEGTYTEIAGKLHLEPETICRAVHEIEAAGLIKREVVGTNGTKNVFTIDKENFDLYAEPHKKEEEKAKKQAKEKMPVKKLAGFDDIVQSANLSADRDRYYARLKADREGRAERYQDYAFRIVPGLKDITQRINKLYFEVVKAEREDRSEYLILEERLKRLQSDRAILLTRYGIKEELMEAKYYGRIQCPECLGTGWNHRTGKACLCWRKK